MEVLRRRKDEEKSKEEQEKELKKALDAKLQRTGQEKVDTSSKVEKDDSLSQMLNQQKADWVSQEKEMMENAKKDRPTLHSIQLPYLKPAAFGVWRAFHEMVYPPPKEVVEDLEVSGIPQIIQEKFKIGFTENLMHVAQSLSQRFSKEDTAIAGIPLLKDYAQKEVPVLVFPYLRDEEICFISCRAFISQEERKELGIPRYVRLGEKAPFPYNANLFHDLLEREKKKVFFLYPSRYRLNVLSKEEDVLVVAEKGFDSIAVRDFHIEEEEMKLFVQVEPVVIIDVSDKKVPDWEARVETLRKNFANHDMVMRLENLPEGVDVPKWFVKSNLGERKIILERPKEKAKKSVKEIMKEQRQKKKD